MWYIVSAAIYILLLTIVLAFFAGAARLNEQAEANSRAKLKLMPRRFPPRAVGRERYRGAA
jgi:hypothetical protein